MTHEREEKDAEGGQATMEAAFAAELSALVAAAVAADRSASRTIRPACGGLSTLCYARCRIGIAGEGPTLVLASIEAVFRDGDLLPEVDMGAGGNGHGLGIWTAARRALEAMLRDGTIGAVEFEAVGNRVIRESLGRRGYEFVGGQGKDPSYRADAATGLKRDGPPVALAGP